MHKNTLLLVLTAIGSGTCWWPAFMDPSLDLPFWRFPLGLIALGTGLATVLADVGWKGVVTSSIGSAFAGLCVGLAIWYPSDGIAASYMPIGLAVAWIAGTVLALVSGFALKKVSVSRPLARRAAWVALFGCVAFGPVVVALTPPLVARRVARNDQLTALRVKALSDAVRRSMAESGDPARECDGSILKRYYSGPAFSESSWHYIQGNAVKENGYFFSLRCVPIAEYRLDVVPAREKGDGTLQFCTGQSGTASFIIGRGQWMRRICTPAKP